MGADRVPETGWGEFSEPGHSDEVVAFWEAVRGNASIGRLGVVTGVTADAVMPPQAWSFGDSPGLADELLGLVLQGVKTATSTSVVEMEAGEEPLPAPGDLSIVLDGAGHPRALIRTTQVDVVPFRDVTEELAVREGEDDRSLASWRREHEKYFRRVLAGIGAEFGEDMLIACERFELVYPTATER